MFEDELLLEPSSETFVCILFELDHVEAVQDGFEFDLLVKVELLYWLLGEEHRHKLDVCWVHSANLVD